MRKEKKERRLNLACQSLDKKGRGRAKKKFGRNWRLFARENFRRVGTHRMLFQQELHTRPQYVRTHNACGGGRKLRKKTKIKLMEPNEAEAERGEIPCCATLFFSQFRFLTDVRPGKPKYVAGI